MQISPKVSAKQYDIHVGMNDKDTLTQKVATEKIVKLVDYVCGNSDVSFSYDVITGGYINKTGTLVNEKSVMLSIIGASEEQINEIAADLCCFLNQETVLISAHDVMTYSVSDTVTENLAKL